MMTDSSSREATEAESDIRSVSTGNHFLDHENRPIFSEGAERSDDTSGNDDVSF